MLVRMIRILAVGDVVGRPGRTALAHFLPRLRGRPLAYPERARQPARANW